MLIPCAAALLTMGGTMASQAAQGWNMVGDTWTYLDSNGNQVTDTWEKSGNDWFYLNDDGEMAKSSLIQFDDDYYYVNSAGAMVSNQWREVPPDEYEDEYSPDSYWYYFQGNGRAYKAPSTGKTVFHNIQKANGDWKKYAFDDQGRMLFGWVGEDAQRVNGEDAWKEGTYYCGNSSDGAQTAGEWSHQQIDDPDNDDNYFDGSYWFYFNTNGKKVKDSTKIINGRKYRFNENGAAEYEWYNLASDTTASPSNLYYNLPSQCWLAKGWFKTVPGETVDNEGYQDDTEYWFYALNNGNLVTSQIKTIDGHRYAFNDKGEMLHGLYKLTFDDQHNIASYDEIETEDDLPGKDDNCLVYYFGDTPKEGVMATGRTTIDLDGERYTYNFRTSGTNKGAGYNSIYDDSIYVQGRLLKADSDARYEKVDYDGKTYLIGSNGKLAKNKKNIKDGDDVYYTTDKNGIVTYEGYEKQ